MDDASGAPPPQNEVLRYMAILSAARDFGLPQSEIVEIATRFSPRTSGPEELAGVLADALLRRAA